MGEIAWRGYVLPLLRNRYSPLSASLILGIMYTSWHLPLILMGKSTWWLMPMQIAATVIWTWLYNNTKSSVFMTALFHASWNTISGIYVGQMFGGADALRMGWITAIVWVLAAIVVVMVFDTNLSNEKNPSSHIPVGTVLGAQFLDK